MSGNSLYLLPNVVMPLLRRVYPSMIGGSGLDREFVMPLADCEKARFNQCTFLSTNKLKKCFRTWRPDKNIHLIKLDFEGNEPIKRVNLYSIPKELDDFIVELASLADLHGIVKVAGNAIWMKQAKDIKDLNVDDRIVDRIVKAPPPKCNAIQED